MAERRGDGVIMYLTGKDWDALRDGRHPGWPVDGIRLRASDLDLRMDLQ